MNIRRPYLWIVFVCLGLLSIYLFYPTQHNLGKQAQESQEKQPLKGTVFVSHHRPFWTYCSDFFQPIHVGKMLSSHSLDIPGDDTGDHISDKNPFYCELTSMYWAWKNRTPGDFVGFFHYRRYLDTVNFHDVPSYGTIPHDQLTSGIDSAEAFVQEEMLCKLMNEYDVLVPPLYPGVTEGDTGLSLAGHYCYEHRLQDWETLVSLLLKKHPKYHTTIKQAIDSKDFYLFHCYVMKDALFQEYATWLFSILFEMESRIAIEKDHPHQKRVFGFLAERLFNIFLAIKKEESNIRVKELSLMQIIETPNA